MQVAHLPWSIPGLWHPPLEHSGTKTRMSQSLLCALLTFHRHLYKIFLRCIVNTCGGSVILTALWAVVSSFVLHTHVLKPPPGTWYVTWETIIFCKVSWVRRVWFLGVCPCLVSGVLDWRPKVKTPGESWPVHSRKLVRNGEAILQYLPTTVD